MARQKFTEEDDSLLAELGVEVEAKKQSVNTPREERIIAGFEEIGRFVEEHGRLPQHGEDNNIFERLYAIRLDRIRESNECRKLLKHLDSKQLLEGTTILPVDLSEDIDDETLLDKLGVEVPENQDITKLTHVKTRSEIRAAEEIAQRIPCADFDNFKPLFQKVQNELKAGARRVRRFGRDAKIVKGEFFILGGQTAYVAEMGAELKAPNGEKDARLRVIYDNGTESDLLVRSLQRALYKDEVGRRITDAIAGPLFSNLREENDAESGTIYVLRSKANHPMIKENHSVIHKIGVTGSDIQRRISNAKLDPTFLMADVEIVATYELSNINRTKLEKLIHRFFEGTRLAIEIKDRFGNPVTPKEWFLVPLNIIDEAVERIKDGSIVGCFYDAKDGKIKESSV